jgi:hypothetical protein
MSFTTVHNLGDGTQGQSASHAGENLMMAWPPDRVDPPVVLLLHVSDVVGLLAPRCGSCPGGPAGGL